MVRKSGGETSLSTPPSLSSSSSLLSPPLFITSLAVFPSETKIGKMCHSQLLGDPFSNTLRKLVLVVRSGWHGCVFRVFCSFQLFRPFHKKCPSAFAPIAANNLKMLIKSKAVNFCLCHKPERESEKHEQLSEDKVKVKSIKYFNPRSQEELSLTFLGIAG